jgi:hypothetical protein
MVLVVVSGEAVTIVFDRDVSLSCLKTVSVDLMHCLICGANIILPIGIGCESVLVGEEEDGEGVTG